MMKWEYRVVALASENPHHDEPDERLEDMDELNFLGEEGWEAFAFVPETISRRPALYMKRPLR